MSKFIKLILSRNEKTLDVRYVTQRQIDHPGLNPREIVTENFKIDHDTEFKITWKDEHGHHIPVSTEHDFKMALQLMQRPVFHISCYPRTSVKLVSGEPVENQILNVNCDVCKNRIEGLRYKCMECPNYNLCSNCEHDGNHEHHFFLRLSSTFLLPGDAEDTLLRTAYELMKASTDNV